MHSQNINHKLNTNTSRIICQINPIFEQLPLPIIRFDDPFLPFSKAVVDATHDLVCGYLFDFPAYLAMGGAGAVALERSLNYVPKDKIKILHGTFSGIGYSLMASEETFALDAITVATKSDAHYYTQHPPHTALLVSLETSQLNTYSPADNRIILRQNTDAITLTVTSNDILYNSKLDDFAEKIREGIQALT